MVQYILVACRDVGVVYNRSSLCQPQSSSFSTTAVRFRLVNEADLFIVVCRRILPATGLQLVVLCNKLGFSLTSEFGSYITQVCFMDINLEPRLQHYWWRKTWRAQLRYHFTTRSSAVTEICAMLHVIEYFTDSLKVIQDHSKWHRLMDRVYELLLAFHSNYGPNRPILYHFRHKARYW